MVSILDEDSCCWFRLCWAFNAVVLSQQNEVIGVDVSKQRVDQINSKESQLLIKNCRILTHTNLSLSASTDLKGSVLGAIM